MLEAKLNDLQDQLDGGTARHETLSAQLMEAEKRVEDWSKDKEKLEHGVNKSTNKISKFETELGEIRKYLC